MTREYSLLIEGDEAGYSGYVPELPSILVTGKSIDELSRRAVEAIQIWRETAKSDISPTAQWREIEVQLPA